VVNNRTRLLSGIARAAFRLRAEVVERSFTLILDWRVEPEHQQITWSGGR
jgi:hypothetical protein